MSTWMLWASALVFVLVSVMAWALLQRFWPDAGAQRLATDVPARIALPTGWSDRLPVRLVRLLGWLSQWSLSSPSANATGTPMPELAPEDAAETGGSRLARSLVQAGWRSRHALWMYGASKTLLLLTLPVLVVSLAWVLGLGAGSLEWWSALLLAGAAGYLLPDGLLRWQLRRRQQALFKAFPDALDLLRVCVQAGLGLDAAIDRVGCEMRLASPLLSEEWRLTGLELRAGASRAMALRHLADRVGLSEIDALVTMLIQADRFGTRMAEALQVHADTLRTQRRIRAEEAAAKLPVKLLIPLVFCVFPALLTVMLGPVAISLYHLFSKQI